MSIAHDYPEIRKRMLGDDKAKPELSHTWCEHCGDRGWIYLGIYAPGYILCSNCKNPDNRPQP